MSRGSETTNYNEGTNNNNNNKKNNERLGLQARGSETAKDLPPRPNKKSNLNINTNSGNNNNSTILPSLTTH